jgi:hypothetical protein
MIGKFLPPFRPQIVNFIFYDLLFIVALPNESIVYRWEIERRRIFNKNKCDLWATGHYFSEKWGVNIGLSA